MSSRGNSVASPVFSVAALSPEPLSPEALSPAALSAGPLPVESSHDGQDGYKLRSSSAIPSTSKAILNRTKPVLANARDESTLLFTKVGTGTAAEVVKYLDTSLEGRKLMCDFALKLIFS